MAPKRAPPVRDPPSASSSEEEETSSGEEEASDDERSQPSPPQPQTKTIRTQNSTPKKPEPTTHQSESELESESGSESGSESEPGQSVKPLTSKPMEQIPPKEAAAAVVKKSRSKPAVAATPEKSTAVKRGNGADRDPKDLKRAKNKQSDPEKSEDSKKQLFQRLWTEEDEISLLQGIIDFIAEKGYDPSKDTNAFFDFIKQSFHFDVSMNQLKDKISRLRKKFENHVKGKKGENKVFSKPHDQKGFDLSKYIWGSEGCIKANGKKNTNLNDNKKGNSKKLEALKADLGIDVGEEERMEVEMERDSNVKKVLNFDRKASVGTMEDYVVSCGLDFAHGVKKEEMEEKWRKLHIAELELFLKRNELLGEQGKIMLSAFKADKD
ncbi:hypothetical protein OIU77_009048 [Salix suchowensis]|uniref:Glabrous enhancer-binding protein-like DBD domain-containing protein n=1 Tax=Salix suchowensis TaxID=1278906 RepID=A0ABQ9AD02_9ROSI|nr:GLABROUS1 enhancer-binding protein [Salix suchowensis]KAJ6292920.1 hypothetical protein OIU78_024992 [Salix suchowensis]KAJ6333106.1 hypothetical protein OIU77_009048 [Salix suchowensis]